MEGQSWGILGGSRLALTSNLGTQTKDQKVRLENKEHKAIADMLSGNKLIDPKSTILYSLRIIYIAFPLWFEDHTRRVASVSTQVRLSAPTSHPSEPTTRSIMKDPPPSSSFPVEPLNKRCLQESESHEEDAQEKIGAPIDPSNVTTPSPAVKDDANSFKTIGAPMDPSNVTTPSDEDDDLLIEDDEFSDDESDLHQELVADDVSTQADGGLTEVIVSSPMAIRMKGTIALKVLCAQGISHCHSWTLMYILHPGTQPRSLSE